MAIRVIQVGLGVRGVQWAEVMKKHPDTEIVAYVRSRVELARKQVAEWGESTPCFRTLEEAFEAVKADAVVLVTPPEVHFEEVKCAIEHGCHVICEKPLSENLDECIEMVRMAANAGLQLQAGMNFRYLSVTQTYRRYVQEKTLGEVGFGHFTYVRHRDGNRHDLNKYPLVMKQPMLLEQSVHHLDLMRYVYGEDVISVSADTWRPAFSTYDDDCCVSALLHFRSGLRANYLGTWTSGCNRLQYEWRTDFSEGTLRQCHQFDELFESHKDPELAMTGTNFKYDPAIEPWTPVDYPECEAFIDDTYGLINEFSDAVNGRKPLITSGRDHLKTLGLVLACVEASQTGQRVDMYDFYKRNNVPARFIDEH